MGNKADTKHTKDQSATNYSWLRETITPIAYGFLTLSLGCGTSDKLLGGLQSPYPDGTCTDSIRAYWTEQFPDTLPNRFPDNIPRQPSQVFMEEWGQVEILDNYDEPGWQINPQDIATIMETLRAIYAVHPEHVQHIRFIAAQRPQDIGVEISPGVYRAHAAETVQGGIAFTVFQAQDPSGYATMQLTACGCPPPNQGEDPATYYSVHTDGALDLVDNLLHEIGHHHQLDSCQLQLDFHSRYQQRFDLGLTDTRAGSIQRNFVDLRWLEEPVAPAEEGVKEPYGAANWQESYATEYGAWGSHTEELILEAISNAESGFGHMLQNTLLQAASRTNGDTVTFWKNNHREGAWPPLEITPKLFSLSDSLLVLGDFEFYISNGFIDGVWLLDENRNEIRIEFGQPVEIPYEFFQALAVTTTPNR